MNENLLIKKGTNLMNRLTTISGNVDVNKLTPSIWISQITDIERVLTKGLYDKVLSDFTDDSLSGDYLIIYDEYVSKMLVFYSTADFIMKNSIMIANGGNFQHTPDNAQVVSSKENERLSKYYRDLGMHFEIKFYDFMKDKIIAEYTRVNKVDVDAFKFGWDI
jgi:hypothetical protein